MSRPAVDSRDSKQSFLPEIRAKVTPSSDLHVHFLTGSTETPGRISRGELRLFIPRSGIRCRTVALSTPGTDSLTS
jgi:hypothetical protein